jgi:hypothetical protein
MTAHDLRELLRQRFDAGEDLRAGLNDELCGCAEAQAYCRRLEALTASLADMPRVAPSPALADAVKARIRAAHNPQTWSMRSLAAALALCLALSIAGGYALDRIDTEAFSAAPLLTRVSQLSEANLLPEAWHLPTDLALPQFTSSIHITEHVSASFARLQRQLEVLPLSPWVLLPASLAGLIIFNGILISLQRRGSPGDHHPIA